MAPGFRARLAGVFYLLTILTGIVAAMASGGKTVALVISSACYVAVTVLFYGLFKAVSPGLSLLAACVSLVGCVLGGVAPFHLFAERVNPLAFFGLYCLLIGYLIFRSTFLPRILGVLMAFGGLGWATFASPELARHLSPFNMLPGVLGETALTVWLLAKGIDERRWREQAGTAK